MSLSDVTWLFCRLSLPAFSVKRHHVYSKFATFFHKPLVFLTDFFLQMDVPRYYEVFVYLDCIIYVQQKCTFNATTNTDTGAFYGSVSVDISFDLGRVHVRGMGEILIQAMIFANQRGEYLTKILVGVCITSINSTMLIVIFDSTGNCLQKWKKKVLFKKKSNNCNL